MDNLGKSRDNWNFEYSIQYKAKLILSRLPISTFKEVITSFQIACYCKQYVNDME